MNFGAVIAAWRGPKVLHVSALLSTVVKTRVAKLNANETKVSKLYVMGLIMSRISFFLYLFLLFVVICQTDASVLRSRAATGPSLTCGGISPRSSNGGRKIAIAIDSSPSMLNSDPNNWRIAAAEALNGLLISNAKAKEESKTPDQVAVIHFGGEAHLDFPLGDPGAANSALSLTGSINGSFIAGGVGMGIQQLNRTGTGSTPGRSSIVVFTDGQACLWFFFLFSYFACNICTLVL